MGRGGEVGRGGAGRVGRWGGVGRSQGRGREGRRRGGEGGGGAGGGGGLAAMCLRISAVCEVTLTATGPSWARGRAAATRARRRQGHHTVGTGRRFLSVCRLIRLSSSTRKSAIAHTEPRTLARSIAERPPSARTAAECRCAESPRGGAGRSTRYVTVPKSGWPSRTPPRAPACCTRRWRGCRSCCCSPPAPSGRSRISSMDSVTLISRMPLPTPPAFVPNVRPRQAEHQRERHAHGRARVAAHDCVM